MPWESPHQRPVSCDRLQVGRQQFTTGLPEPNHYLARASISVSRLCLQICQPFGAACSKTGWPLKRQRGIALAVCGGRLRIIGSSARSEIREI